MGFLNYAWQPLARLSEGQVDSVVVATGLFAAEEVLTVDTVT